MLSSGNETLNKSKQSKTQDLTSKIVGICENKQGVVAKAQIMRRVRSEEARREKKGDYYKHSK